MKLLKAIKIMRYFIKTTVGTFLWALLIMYISKTTLYQDMWESNYSKPAMALGIAVVPVLLALKDYKDNERMIKSIIKGF